MGALEQIACAGGSAVITVTFIHPIDVVKTRLQASGEVGRAGVRNYSQLGIFGSVKVIAAEEGVTAFWKGINAAWLRESSYTSLRLGLYAPIKEILGAKDPNSPFYLKFSAASLSGALGSLVGNPFDVLKTSLMANEGQASIMATGSSLLKNQGVTGLYRGIQANIMRAMVLNGTKMACYDTIKTIVCDVTGMSRKNPATQFLSAFGAGFFMVCTVAPFDMIRTRLMNQPPDAKIYSGFADCAKKIVAKEGPMALYKGFIPIWSRFAPTTTLQLMIFERLSQYMGIGGL